MITYSVTVTVNPEIESEWADWMTRVHVRDVLRTGCFTECRMLRVLDAPNEQCIYVMQYDCRSIETYRRYQDEFAPALQKDHADRFAAKVRGSRQLLEEVTRIEHQG